MGWTEFWELLGVKARASHYMKSVHTSKKFYLKFLLIFYINEKIPKVKKRNKHQIFIVFL